MWHLNREARTTLVQRVCKAMKASRRRFGHLEVTSDSGVLPPVNPALSLSSQVHFFKHSLLHRKLNGPHNVLGPWVRPLNKMGMALWECTSTVHCIRCLATFMLAFPYVLDEYQYKIPAVLNVPVFCDSSCINGWQKIFVFFLQLFYYSITALKFFPSRDERWPQGSGKSWDQLQWLH